VSCGAVLLAGEVFCGECGTPVAKVEGGSKSEEDRLLRTMNRFAPSMAAPAPSSATKSSPVRAASTPASQPQQHTPQKTAPAPKQVVQSSSPARASSTPKFCPECGAKVSTVGVFCSECGVSYSGSSASVGSGGSSSKGGKSGPTISQGSSSALSSDSPSTSSGNLSTIMVDEAPVCGSCNKGIEGGAYEFQGKSYHESCWRCQGCNSNLNGIPFGLKDGRPWCKDCNFGRPKEYCPTCGQLILEGSYTKALGNTYHSSCFKCDKCSTPIGKGIGFFEKEGQIICKNCS